jgi:hypothetical protein
MRQRTCFLFLLLFYTIPTWLPARDVVVIHDKKTPASQKEAILILPGFGSKLHGNKDQKKYFSQTEYDLFIPDYISRKSVEKSVDYVTRFMEKHHLSDYAKIHVFSYIVGSWTINSWILQHPKHNIASIVYDRSPLQERAPLVLVKDSPFLIRILAGPIMREFSQTPYPPIPKSDIKMGILVEGKATKLIRRHQRTTLAIGPIRWDLEQFNQAHDDALYTWLNHDDMYERFDVIGADILFFFKHGHFTDTARRIPLEGDPFEKHRE